jgi:dTDP-4-dehydrorhamnose 3,5-epimerase
MNRVELPHGVRLIELEMNRDPRGHLTEFFREEWRCGVEAVQWNVARSAPGSLRGLHVHPLHDDLVVLAAGRLAMGLHDFRRGSPTMGLSALVELDADRMQALVIPRGVGHGSLHLEPTVLLVGVSEYWGDPLDELGCRWDDPALGIEWPLQPSLVTERDATAPSLAELLELLEPWQPFVRRDLQAAAPAAAT